MIKRTNTLCNCMILICITQILYASFKIYWILALRKRMQRYGLFSSSLNLEIFEQSVLKLYARILKDFRQA